MTKIKTLWRRAVLLGALAALPLAAAADDTRATAGAGGVYPSGTSFSGVEVRGLQLGAGAEVFSNGAALGNFTAVLLGVSALGTEQRITIQGAVTGGARNAANVAVLTGVSTVDLGDGTAPAVDVPFTATLTSNASELGAVGLTVVGFTQLPNASLNQGSLSIESVPSEAPAAPVNVASAGS
jgi:hypothetical protein